MVTVLIIQELHLVLNLIEKKKWIVYLLLI